MPATIPIHDTDRVLATDIRSGSKAAFGRLYARYAPALLGFIMKMVPDQKAAEDILQQSFLAMWDGRHSITSQPLFAWVLGITRKTTLSTVNNAAPAEIQNLSSFVNINNVINTSEEATGREQLEKAVFDLVYYNGYNLIEAAGLMNVDSDNLKLLLRNAVNNLKTPVK